MKIISSRPGLFLALGFVILVIPEILKVYFIMPLPGSQHENHVQLAYSINKFIWLSRIIGAPLLLLSVIAIYKNGRLWAKIVSAILVLLAGGIVYVTTFIMLADKIFYQPKHKLMRQVAENKIDDERLVLGVELNGEAKAYPIYVIGYHHQVRDTIGGEPVMITYCSVCRTGRVYKPEVEGKPENFRLVGMDQFNAMFEDATTKSWWRQATGECCAGPLKGAQLKEIPAEQMTLKEWKLFHPNTLVMQQDPDFTAQYKSLNNYDIGSLAGGLTGTDTASFQPKSWIIGIVTKEGSKIYDWNVLKKQKVINDVIGAEPVVLVLENDNQSFHAFSRLVNDSVLEFYCIADKGLLVDMKAERTWDFKGKYVPVSLDGRLKDLNENVKMPDLKPIQAYQEFYHSFTTFHPGAKVYK